MQPITETQPHRKVIQLCDWGGDLVYLCDDGTVWRLLGKQWHRALLPPGCDPQGLSGRYEDP